MFQRVLVPLDGTGLAEGILPYVSQLSKGLGMELVLLAVVDPDAVEIPERLGRTGSGETTGHIESIGFGGPVMVGVTAFPSLGNSTSLPNGAECQSTGRRITGMTTASPVS